MKGRITSTVMVYLIKLDPVYIVRVDRHGISIHKVQVVVRRKEVLVHQDHRQLQSEGHGRRVYTTCGMVSQTLVNLLTFIREM